MKSLIIGLAFISCSAFAEDKLRSQISETIKICPTVAGKLESAVIPLLVIQATWDQYGAYHIANHLAIRGFLNSTETSVSFDCNESITSLKKAFREALK